MQHLTLLETKAFARTIKELQRDKSCKNTAVLLTILEELIEKVGSASLTHFFSHKGLRFYKKRLRHPCSKEGRSGSARLIFAVLKKESTTTIILTALYFKSEKEHAPKDEILGFLASGVSPSQAQEILGSFSMNDINRFLESLVSK